MAGERASQDRPLMHLLSQAYVAFTIEFDNAWEGRLIKRGIPPRFLVSYVMWANCMRYLQPGVATPRDELEARCSVWNGPIHLGRMEQWWGYLEAVDDDALRPSVAGVMALESWDGVADAVNDAWAERLGDDRFRTLSSALAAIERGLDLELPDTMPALAYNDGYRTPIPEGGPTSPAGPPTDNMGALLARVLLAATLAAEDGAAVPVPTAAVVLRVLRPQPIKVKEIAGLAAVRKEAVSPAITHLRKAGMVTTEGKGAAMTVAVTSDGAAAQAEHAERVAAVEAGWRKRFGASVVGDLRDVLTSLHEPSPAGSPLLAQGLEPPEKGWRVSKAYRAQTDLMLQDPAAGLPVHPLLTHRGGWPDGA